MVTKKDNLKALFTNTRTRVIIVFTALALVIAIIIGFIRFNVSSTVGPEERAQVSSSPSGIRSIPGSTNPTAQYAALQAEQNVKQAEEAAKTGGSAIPTIIRTQRFGDGIQTIGPSQGEGGVGFSSLGNESISGQQKNVWLDIVKQSNCSKDSVEKVLSEGGTLDLLKQACSCLQFKNYGYSLNQLDSVCSCQELKSAGVKAKELKDAGYSAARLRRCGFTACEVKSAGFSALEMADAGFSQGELKGAGFSEVEISRASGLPEGITSEDVLKSGCNSEALKRLRASGVSAAAIRRISGCKPEQLKAAGFLAEDLKKAGFTAAELRRVGYTPVELQQAGFSAQDINPPKIKLASGKAVDCTVDSLRSARSEGISASRIRQSLGCDVSALKEAGYTATELNRAGYSPAELKNAGFSARSLKNAGFSAKALSDVGFTPKELKDAGFRATELKAVGLSAADLRAAGFTPQQLKASGLSASELKSAGFSARELKNIGFSAGELKNAGFTPEQLNQAGFSPEESGIIDLEEKANLASGSSRVMALPGITTPSSAAEQELRSQRQLQAILQRQQNQMADQQFQQKVRDKQSAMMSAANQALSNWKEVSQQVFVAGSQKAETGASRSRFTATGLPIVNENMESSVRGSRQIKGASGGRNTRAIVKTGDVMFAVIDTSVNSDEPSPILATIVSGKLKGAKLIGSFTLPNNADKMVISFNTLSAPGAAATTSINAYAIDPNTARTALSTYTNHHYLQRYGALFASTFLEGFGNAFQSANTSITIGGTGGVQTTTVQNGIGRSVLENAVIGLATLGKHWGQVAQQQFNRPTTVEVCSGTGIGVLFTQDITSI